MVLSSKRCDLKIKTHARQSARDKNGLQSGMVAPSGPMGTFGVGKFQPQAEHMWTESSVETPGRGMRAETIGLFSRVWQAATKADLGRKVAETYATQLLRVGIGLLISAILARALGPAGLGLYGVAVAIGTLGIQLANGGLHISNTYYVAKNRALLPALLGNALRISLLGGSVLGGGAWIVFLCWPALAPLSGSLLTLALAWIPVGLAYLLLLNLLLGLQMVRAYNGIELGNRLLSLGLIVLLVALRVARVETTLIASLIALLVSSGVALWCLRSLSSVYPRVSMPLFKDTIGVGFRAYLVCLFSFLVLRIDLLMVKYMLGAEQAGYYSVAATIADYVSMFAAVVALILFPKLSALSDNAEKLRMAKRAAFGTGVALLPAVVVAAAFAKFLIPLLFGSAFLPAASALIWLLPGIFFLGIEVVIVQFLNSQGFPSSLIVLWAVSTVLNIGLNLWAIPRHGITGASAVSSISYFLVFSVVWWIIWRGKYSEKVCSDAAVPNAVG